MNHPSDDELLLYAYGETDGPERHLAECAECRARFTAIEESRALLDMGMQSKRPARRLVWLVPLAAAAGVGALLLSIREPAKARASDYWSTLTGSPVGYVTDASLMSIDSQLTRLEQGGSYEKRN